MNEKPVTCHHFLENFLPARQAYIYNLLVRLQSLGVRNEVWSYKASNSEMFPFYGVHVLAHESIRQALLIRAIAKARRMNSYLAAYHQQSESPGQPWVAHAHFLWMARTVRELKLRSRVPICLTSYGEDELFRWQTTQKKSANLMLAESFSDIILVPSRFILSIMREALASSKLVLSPLGIDADRHPRVRHAPKANYNILSVARLIPRKGLRYLVQAMPMVLKEFPRTVLTIIGEGDEKDAIEALTRRLGIEASLKIIPYQLSLVPYFASSDLFVLPSIVMPDGVTEGLGVTLLEAEASCLPVVASNVGGIPEAVKDGSTGILVHPGEPPEIADAIVSLLIDERKRQRMGDAGRKHVESEFNVMNQASEMLETYRKLSQS